MARAKKVTDSKPRWVDVEVTRSFEALVIGDTFRAELTERALDLIGGGYLRAVSYGPSASGPGPAHEDDQGGSPQDAEPEGAAGTEPGQDFGSGGYGTS